VREQVPELSRDTVEPDTVQTATEVEVKLNAVSPDEAVAVRLGMVAPNVTSVRGPKVTVWLAGFTT
jgi:hypothetical protein